MEGKFLTMSVRGSQRLSLVAVQVLLAVLAIGCQAAHEPAPIDWKGSAKLVCHDNAKLKVQSISHMSKLLAAINAKESCKSRYLSAIHELDPILKLRNDSFCDDHAFELIKDYHFRFIQPFKQANRKPTQFEPLPRDLVKGQLFAEPRKYTVDFDEHNQVLMAPISLRHFFLKLALQASAQCKKNLVANLDADAERFLTDKDREVMQLFDRKSPIGGAVANNIDKLDFDNVLHIPELDGRLITRTGEEVLGEGREQHLKTTAREDSALFQMIYACKHRFKPLYEKLIMPIVRLSKLGYDYQGHEGLTESEQQFLAGDKIQNWLVIVHICEIFKNTHLIRVEPKRRPKTLLQHLQEIEADDDKHEEASQKSLAGGGEPSADEEGKLSPMTDEEVREAAERQKRDEDWLKMFSPMEYEPTVRNQMADKLMIDSERQLDTELARKYGGKNVGPLSTLLRKISSNLKKVLAKLDFERFAHYRRHSLFYTGLVNCLSMVSNVASITVTILGMFGSLG